MSTTHDHTKLVADTRVALGREPDLVLHLNSVPVVRTVRGHSIFTATPGLGTGTLDLVGLLTLTIDGRRFAQWIELDAKTGKAVPNKEQRMRIALVRKKGGFACTFRSVDEARAALERARRGENE
jgi:hypothetical protein